MMMEYRVTCGCGKAVAVSAGAAGSRVTCDCGRSVDVPSLRELRRLSGEADTVNPVLVIEKMLAAGELPLAQDCAICGRADAAVVKVVAECERRWLRRPGRWDWLVVAIFSLPLAILAHIWQRSRSEVQEFGRDVILTLPLRLCTSCREDVRSRTDIAALLAEVPIYAQLLNRYPDAKLSLPANQS
jgi:hypothetical protein